MKRSIGPRKRTAADKQNALTLALHQADDDRALSWTPADLRWTGADMKLIECQLLARQDAIRRRRAAA